MIEETFIHSSTGQVGGTYRLSLFNQTHKYLSLQPLPVVVEEAEAVEFVLWRRVVGLTAPAAWFMSGSRPRRLGLIQTDTNTNTSLN